MCGSRKKGGEREGGREGGREGDHASSYCVLHGTAKAFISCYMYVDFLVSFLRGSETLCYLEPNFVCRKLKTYPCADLYLQSSSLKSELISQPLAVKREQMALNTLLAAELHTRASIAHAFVLDKTSLA